MAITDTAQAHGTPCVTWTRGPLTGQLPHIPLPAARLGGTVLVDCHRCGTYLYTYKEEK